MGIRESALNGANMDLATGEPLQAPKKATPPMTDDDSAALRDLHNAVKAYFTALNRSPIAAVPMAAVPSFAALLELTGAIEHASPRKGG